MSSNLNIHYLCSGKPASMQLEKLLTQIASGTKPAENPFSDAVTGTVKDAWFAWHKAIIAFNNNRTTNAYDHLKDSNYLQPVRNDTDSIADIERAVLIAECLQVGYQIDAGLSFTDIAHFGLLKYINKYTERPDEASREIAVMISTIAGVHLQQSTYTAAEIFQAWAVTRGIDILCRTAATTVNLLPAGAGKNTVENIVTFLLEAVNELKRSAGCAFSKNKIAELAFTVANCLTVTDPAQGIEYFRLSIKVSDPFYHKKLTANNNIANCLVRLGRFGEAMPIYEHLIPRWLEAMDYTGAARIQIALCIARWKNGERDNIHGLLVQAIEYYESNRPGDYSIVSRYQQKGFIEEAYLLLITLHCSQPSLNEKMQKEVTGAATALLSKDQFSGLSKKNTAAGWEGLIDKNNTAIEQIKFTLQSFPRHCLLLLISGIDCLIWIVMGFDEQQNFIFETSVIDAAGSRNLTRFLELMNLSLEADLNHDKSSLFATNKRLKEAGRSVSDSLSPSFMAAIEKMEHIYYLPHHYGNIDEFPPGGLIINGVWLAQRCSITRAASFNHFREMLAINRTAIKGGKKSVVIHGNATAGNVVLKNAASQGLEVARYHGLFGFDSGIRESFTKKDFINWLNGEVAVIHYIGHGISTDINEGLPIDGQHFIDIIDIDKITGSNTPFVFICACLAGRVRAGRGGYQAGIASKIAERMAPAVVAFNMPVTEDRAYYLAKEFYRNAKQYRFGNAVQALFKSLPEDFPDYAWLSLTAYGDPSYKLASAAGTTILPMACLSTKTWFSSYRLHAVLRTEQSFEEAAAGLSAAPALWQKETAGIVVCLLWVWPSKNHH